MLNHQQNVVKPVIEGYARKKSNRGPLWSSRFFVLKEFDLCCYSKEPVVEEGVNPIATFVLQTGCTVSEITAQYSRTKQRMLHCFKLQWPGTQGKGTGGKEEGTIPNEKEPTDLSHCKSPLTSSCRDSLQASSFPLERTSSTNDRRGSEPHHHKISKHFSKTGPFLGTEVVVKQRGYDDTDDMMMGSFFEGNETLQQLIKVKNSAVLLKKYQEEQSKSQHEGSEKKKKKKPTLSKKSAAGIAALAVSGVIVGAATAGIGLAAGIVVLGLSAAAGGGVAAYGASHGASGSKSGMVIVLGFETQDEATRWKKALEQQIHLREEVARVIGDSSIDNGAPIRSTGGPAPQTRLIGVEIWKSIDFWVSTETVQGLRIYDPHPDQASILQCPVKRAEVCIPCNSFEAFMCLMASPHSTLCGVVESMRLVHTFNDHSDVIHLCLRRQFLFPTWTAPRDFCFNRFWRYDDNGTYTVCWDSIIHKDCPPVKGFVRGEIHSVFVVTPRKGPTPDADATECLVTQVVQIDPKGWIWKSFDYMGTLTARMLWNLLDLKDTIQRERFEAALPESGASFLADMSTNDRTSLLLREDGSLNGLDQCPPSFNKAMWGEPDSTTFSVRGLTYMSDKVKVASADSLFCLVAVDFFELPTPMKHIVTHPQNRVQIARARGPHPFLFIIQIMIPGPPYYALVAYFTPVDTKIFEYDSPFNRIAKLFFFGDDDVFRDNRFKLIPQMIEAPYMVKKAAGNTPTLIGTKLKQSYFRGPNYFELDLDVASSAIAARITRLAVGYSKNVVVDIGFVLQGNTSEELPEHMMCAVRCKKIDVETATPLS